MAEYSYRFSTKALKQLSKLPGDVQKRVFAKLDFFCQADLINYAEKLTSSDLGQYRFRVGDYRVLFDVDGTLVTILKVGHRREIYR